MNLLMFQFWLLPHKETLTHITIGYSTKSSSTISIFQSSLFPNLEFLHLSRWQMADPLHFHVEHADILGPRLKLFRWDFMIARSGSQTWSWKHFGLAELSWLGQLAQTAVSRASVLEKIEVFFQPTISGIDASTIYPWDGMTDIRDNIMRPSGRDLTYDEPPCSRDEWQRYKGEGAAELGLDDGYYYEEYWETPYDGTLDPMEIAADEASEGWSDTNDEESEDEDESYTDGEGLSEDDERRVKWMKYQGEDIRDYFVREKNAE